ncbi:hypothetical protein [Actinomyces provencensis]|uniref:hypothetical protein n=1 Tax=Actinomyces provencensis TaxID=1720198 RepID=UPI00096A9FEA|nr:hypothetical protein [Actinomyces provencensis]
MTDQDPDARIPDPETAPPSDADLVLDAQPVFEPDATPVDAPDPADPTTTDPTATGPSAAEHVDEGVPAPGIEPEQDPAAHEPYAAGDHPADVRPDDLHPADLHPADDLPQETPLQEGAPVDAAPADTTPVDTTPVDTTPVDEAPARAAEPSPSDEPVVLPTTVEPAVPVEVAETIEVVAPQEPAAAALPDESPEAPGTAPEDTTTTTSHHIPAVPLTDHDAAPLPPSSAPGEETAPEGTPPDVLGNRSQHHTHGDGATGGVEPALPPDTSAESDPAAAGTAAAQRTSILPAPTAPGGPTETGAAAGPGAHGEGVGDGDDLDQTRVHRRSFVAPQEEEADQGEAQWRPRSSTEEDGSHSSSTPRSLDDALFEGATVVPEVPSRAAAHVWSLLLTLLLVPLAWYLLADAGARMTLATDNPMSTGILNPAALAELVGGVLVVVLIAVLARHSSLGAHVVGIVVTVLGLPWVVAPGASARLVLPAMEWLDQWNAFGANLAHHLQASGYSGRLLLVGIALLLLGWTSHRVRRSGRDEEALRAEVERVNPQGAHLTWRERRRAARAAGER